MNEQDREYQIRAIKEMVFEKLSTAYSRKTLIYAITQIQEELDMYIKALLLSK